MYAVVETGGKQIKTVVGAVIDVERLPAEVDEQVVLDKVVLVSDDGQVQIGQPYVSGVRVIAKVVGQVKGPKIVGFKYKAKQNQRKHYGHRQPYTRLRIESIES